MNAPPPGIHKWLERLLEPGAILLAEVDLVTVSFETEGHCLSIGRSVQVIGDDDAHSLSHVRDRPGSGPSCQRDSLHSSSSARDFSGSAPGTRDPRGVRRQPGSVRRSPVPWRGVEPSAAARSYPDALPESA